MNPSTAYTPILAQSDLSYPAQNPYAPQQAYEPCSIPSALNSAFPMQSQGGQFTTGQSHMPHSFDPSLALRSHEHYSVGPAGDAQPTPALPMDPPTRPRKRKAPTLRADDWKPYKARIVELHVTQGLPLKEVKEKMENEFGFSANERQYRTRISQWGKDKNIKSEEMGAIVRKRQQRKLVDVNKGELNFEVRGNQVEPQKIDRWMKRNNVPGSVLYAPSPAASTPSDVYCRTIPERDSPAPSPAYSAATPILSPGGIISIASSPSMCSPALSVASLVRPQSSTFTGQSPAPTYRSLPSSFPGSVPVPGGHADQLATIAGSLPYRYRQTDEERLREELSRAETLFGLNHFETLGILSKLGRVLIDQGRYKSAEEVIRRSVQGHLTMGGSEEVDVLDALDDLGHVLDYQGLYSKAEKLHRWTFERRRAVLGGEHVDTLTSVSHLGWVLGNQGKFEEAEAMHRRDLESSEKVLGLEHPDTFASVSSLGSVLSRQGKYEEAEAMQRRALEGYKKVLGLEHPYTLINMSSLAEIFWYQTRWKEAEDLEMRVLETRKRILGDEHPDTLAAMDNLAFTLKSQGRNQEALGLMRACLQMRNQILSSDHPDTRASLEVLNEWQMESIEVAL